MSKIYKVSFRPSEPYFFGNEKSFPFPGETASSSYASSYFIKSEKIPSQSTILGALRYIFLPYKWEDMTGTDNEIEIKKNENKEAVGDASFNFKEVNQSFGYIEKISPIFIGSQSSPDVMLIATPKDHIKDENNKKYLPFSKYCSVKTAEKNSVTEKLYAADFDVKEGLESSFVSVENGEIFNECDIFKTDLRIGINRNTENDGFFKKEYCMLQDDFVFSVFATLSDNVTPKTEIVFLGQGKSPFVVTFEPASCNFEDNVKAFLEKYERTEKGKIIYCLSDCFVNNFNDNEVLFCAIDVKDYRTFTTLGKGNFKKDSKLYRQLKAGSIVIVSPESNWTEINSNKNA